MLSNVQNNIIGQSLVEFIILVKWFLFLDKSKIGLTKGFEELYSWKIM